VLCMTDRPYPRFSKVKENAQLIHGLVHSQYKNVPFNNMYSFVTCRLVTRTVL
jgi:hypothetical protein